MTDLESTYRLEGPVTFANVDAVRAAGEAAIAAAGDHPVVDLSGLESANSVAVALLMAWFREATHLGKTVAFRDASAGLRNIVDLSGLGGVLPLQDAEGTDAPAASATESR